MKDEMNAETIIDMLKDGKVEKITEGHPMAELAVGLIHHLMGKIEEKLDEDDVHAKPNAKGALIDTEGCARLLYDGEIAMLSPLPQTLYEGRDIPTKYNKRLKSNEVWTLKGSIANYKQALLSQTRVPVIMELDGAYSGERPTLTALKEICDNIMLSELRGKVEEEMGKGSFEPIFQTLYWDFLASLETQINWLQGKIYMPILDAAAQQCSQLTLATKYLPDTVDLEIGVLLASLVSGRLLPLAACTLLHPNGFKSNAHKALLKAAKSAVIQKTMVSGDEPIEIHKPMQLSLDFLLTSVVDTAFFEVPDLHNPVLQKTTERFLTLVGLMSPGITRGAVIELTSLTKKVNDLLRIDEDNQAMAILEKIPAIEGGLRNVHHTILEFLDRNMQGRETGFDTTVWDELLDKLGEWPDLKALVADALVLAMKKVPEACTALDTLPWRVRGDMAQKYHDGIGSTLDAAKLIEPEIAATHEAEQKVLQAAEKKQFTELAVFAEQADAAQTSLKERLEQYQVALGALCDLLDDLHKEVEGYHANADEGERMARDLQAAEDRTLKLEEKVKIQQIELADLKVALAGQAPETAPAAPELDTLPVILGMCRNSRDVIKAASQLYPNLNIDHLTVARNCDAPKEKLMSMLQRLNDFAINGDKSVFTPNEYSYLEGEKILASHRKDLSFRVDKKGYVAESHLRVDKSMRLYFHKEGQTVYVRWLTNHL